MSGRLGIDKKQAVDFGLAGFIDKPARLHFDQSVDLLDATGLGKNYSAQTKF
jgi:hypothetical protein